MDLEKNFTSSIDGEENELTVFGGSKTQKITTLFWSRYEGKRVTGAGHYAWTSCRKQEAGKTGSTSSKQTLEV
jgi:hypothetical protein